MEFTVIQGQKLILNRARIILLKNVVKLQRVKIITTYVLYVDILDIHVDMCVDLHIDIDVHL